MKCEKAENTETPPIDDNADKGRKGFKKRRM